MAKNKTAEAPTAEGSFDFDINLNDVPESILLEDGEYTMRIDKIEKKTSKSSDYEYFNAILQSTEEPTADSVYFMIGIPIPSDDEKKSLNKKRGLKKFLDAAQVDYSSGSFNINDAVGQEITVLLKQEEHEGRLSNKVVRLVG